MNPKTIAVGSSENDHVRGNGKTNSNPLLYQEISNEEIVLYNSKKEKGKLSNIPQVWSNLHFTSSIFGILQKTSAVRFL